MSATHRVATVVRRLGLDRSRVWLTRAVGVVTLTVSVAAFASPALMQVLTRNVAQMRAGQWWRLMTPVVVQPDGWGHLVFNLLGLGVVGGALERYTSRPVWALTYLLGGVGGIAVMGARHPADLGGGSSDGVAALIGALTVLLAGEDRPDHHDRMGRRSWAGRPTQDYCVFFGAYLTGLDLGGSGGPSPPATPRSSPSSSPVVH